MCSVEKYFTEFAWGPTREVRFAYIAYAEHTDRWTGVPVINDSLERRKMLY